MTLRHAAALALVGWYLMLAPHDLHYAVVPSAPLSQWKLQGSYDTAAQCMKVRSERIERLTNSLRAIGPDQQPLDEAGTRESFATIFKCIATDDPRLKGN
jgi:hypothetical protein